MGIMALLVNSQLEHPVNLDDTLRMILIHDLVKAECGDFPYFAVTDRAQKQEREAQAMEKIKTLLPEAVGTEIDALWREFENGASSEARLCRALDTLKVQIQHNLADLHTWDPLESST